MHAYKYDPTTHEYLGTCPLIQNPRRPDAPCLPAFATEQVPPEAQAGNVARWMGSAWEVVEDHRGTPLWRKDDKSRFMLRELGPIPVDCTTLEPGRWDKWDETAQSWVTDLDAMRLSYANAIRAERDRRLRVSDPMALPDYPHADDTARLVWLAYRQALRQVPEQEGFPWGGVSDPAVPWPVEPA